MRRLWEGETEGTGGLLVSKSLQSGVESLLPLHSGVEELFDDISHLPKKPPPSRPPTCDVMSTVELD